MVDSEDLMKLSDAELIEFADTTLGILIPKDSPRSLILTKIVNAATETIS